MLITVGMFWTAFRFFPDLCASCCLPSSTTGFRTVILTLSALGQFTPPLAVNLMVSCQTAHVRMEETVLWWMLGAMFWYWLQ
jgi:hypothetical protein